MEREAVVLTYGRTRRRPWRWIVVSAAFVVGGYALAWWATPRVREWREERVRRAEIAYRIQTNLDQSVQSICQGHWADAQITIDRARLASCADPTIFTPAEVAAVRSRIDQAQARLQATEDYAAQHETVAFVARPRWHGCVFVRTTPELIGTAEQAMREERYAEAEQTLSQVLVLDPENARAAELFPNAVNERPIDPE